MLEAIVSAALHAVVASLVVGAVLGAIVFIVVRVLALSAAARHSLWTIALVTTALVPIAAFGVSAARTVDVPAATMTAPAPMTVSGGRASRSETHAAGSRRSARHESSASSSAPSSAPAFSLPDLHLTRAIALGIVGVWALGAAIGFGGLIASLIRVRGLKRRSSPLDGALADDLPWLTEGAKSEREIYLRLSYEIETPVAIGFRRPVILIPTELATANGLVHIEPLVMHEHAHLARYDDWTNLVQRAIERLFWFNPLVWIVGRRIALEREIASDEAVVARTGQPKEYATSLWRLAREMRMPEHAVVAPGALLTRKQISIRIETLLSGRTPIPALGPVAALGIVGAAVLSIVAAASSAPALQLPAPAAAPVMAALPASAPQTPIAREPAALVTVHHGRHAEPRTVAQVVPAIPSPAATPRPHPSARVHVNVHVNGADGVSVDTDGIKRSINDIVERSLASVPAAMPHVVAQWQDHRDVPKGADLATIAQILRQCHGCDMSDRNLRGIDLRGITLVGTNFADADLRDARLDGAVFSGVNLSGAKLDGASLVNARFTGVNIEDVSLHGAKLTGFRVIGSSFADMDLHQLDVRAMLDGCVGCNLSGTNLAGADLHGVTLTGANLADANLQNVNFSGARLSGTNFDDANLHGADFTNASLNGCNFSDANVSGARFTGAELNGANLRFE